MDPCILSEKKKLKADINPILSEISQWGKNVMKKTKCKGEITAEY